MLRSGFRAARGAILLLLLSAPASAQYMYLDTNGDGVHTDADVIQPSGTTTLDLWIRTNANRDSSPATCDTGDGDLTLSGYEFILHATNGTMGWGSVTNQVAAFSTLVGPTSNGADLHAGAFGGGLPPGTYRLATIQASPASGTPRLDIVEQSPLDGTFITGFGSQCSGFSFSNTLTLGLDWVDVDGAAYGGVANAPPTLDPIPNLVVQETSVLEQTLAAHDADGTPLQFAKSSGPPFLSVTTVDPGTGTASGLARLTPGYADAGTTTASVDVTDQIATAHAEFQITVENKDRAPTMDQPADMNAFTGHETSQDLHASDPDGEALHFLLVSGQSFVTVTTLNTTSPALGRVRLAPGQYDSGTTTVTVAASDGLLQAERSFTVTVFLLQKSPPLLCRPYAMTVVAGTSADQTLMLTDADGNPFTFYIAEGPAFLHVSAGDQSATPQTAILSASPSSADLGVHTAIVGATYGSESVQECFRITVVAANNPAAPESELFTSTFRAYDVCDIPQGVVLADLNKDGRMDVITANYGCGISVLLGVGNGQFPDRREVPLDGNPKAATVADLDGDGDLDVLVANGFGNQIEILAGDGTGAFARVGALPAGPDASYACAADMNGDGILDVVGADEAGNSISVYLGLGGMSYGLRHTYPAGQTPCFTAIGDFNRDGIPDVAAANEGSNALSIHMGIGGGALATRFFVPTADGPSSVVPGDFDGDGIMDLAATGFYTNLLTVLFGDGEGGFPRRADPTTGSNPWSVFATDVNGDGHLDLASANTGEATVGVVLGNGDGTFRPFVTFPAGSVPRFVAGGDVNGDGRTDLVVAHEGGGMISVMTGLGGGAFGSARTVVPDLGANSLAMGDVTGDGVSDIVIAPFEVDEVQIHPGLGGGNYGTPIRLATGSEAYSLRLGDVNRDNVLDVLMTLEDAPAGAIYLGGPALGQAPPLPLPGAGGGRLNLELGDWNKDGALDLAVTSVQERLTIFDGDGAGGFSNPRDIQLPSWAGILKTGDLDGDGILDLAVSLSDAGCLVLWGDGAGFTQGPVLPAFRGVTGLAAGDLDGDGRAELVVSERGSDGGIVLFRKVPHGELAVYRWSSRAAPPTRVSYPAGSSPAAPSIADVTGDGRPDLLVTEFGASVIGILPGLADGTFGARQDYGTNPLPGNSVVEDVTGDGRRDIIAAGRFQGGITLLRNLGTGSPPPLAARAFISPGDRTLRLQSGKPTLCVHLEPVGASFLVTDVDPTTIQLSRTGSGTAPIHAIATKDSPVGDSDHNGVKEVTPCFAREDLRQLFSDIRGARAVSLQIIGALTDGHSLSADLALQVVSRPLGPPAVRVAPNPFNPTGALSFELARPSRVRITLHDVSGRTVARLYDVKAAPAGEYTIPLGRGRTKGIDLASGVYFFRLETDEGVATGRFTVLK